jgi:hypothetical protein
MGREGDRSIVCGQGLLVPPNCSKRPRSSIVGFRRRKEGNCSVVGHERLLILKESAEGIAQLELNYE